MADITSIYGNPIKDANAMPKTGGQFTGQVTTTQTSFTSDQQLITKKYADTHVERAAAQAGLAAQGSFPFGDGDTHFLINSAGKSTIHFNLEMCTKGPGSNLVMIDWGDGSDLLFLNEIKQYYLTHSYPARGKYIITLRTKNPLGSEEIWLGAKNSIVQCLDQGIVLRAEIKNVNIGEKALWGIGHGISDPNPIQIYIGNIQNTMGSNGIYISYLSEFYVTSTPFPISATSLEGLVTRGLTKIYVPKGGGQIFKTATNWSAYADYIYEVLDDATIENRISALETWKNGLINGEEVEY